MLKKLEAPNTNIIAIIVIEIFTLSVTYTLNYNETNWSSIATKWAPAIIALITLLCYFISRVFFKKYNWIISLIGILIMIIATLNSYQSYS